MTNVIDEIVSAANEVASVSAESVPNAPITQIVDAVAKTIADPSPANIVADIELATNLVSQLKANLSGTHPSIMGIIKALL